MSTKIFYALLFFFSLLIHRLLFREAATFYYFFSVFYGCRIIVTYCLLKQTYILQANFALQYRPHPRLCPWADNPGNILSHTPAFSVWLLRNQKCNAAEQIYLLDYFKIVIRKTLLGNSIEIRCQRSTLGVQWWQTKVMPHGRL